MSADEGKRSRPVAHLGFSEERVCSHRSGVLGMREREGKEGQAVAEEEADDRRAEVTEMATLSKRLNPKATKLSSLSPHCTKAVK